MSRYEASPLIMFRGPPLAGCKEFAARLGWLETCTWQVPRLPYQHKWGRIGPALVQWRDRRLLVDLGYRGSFWTPRLGSEDWTKYSGENWSAFRWMVERSLRTADAVLFVVDSQRDRMDANMELLERLDVELRYVGRTPESMPVVFALNKRDLEGIDGAQLLPVAELQEQLRWPVCSYVETSARTGDGVDATVARLLELAT